MGANYRYEFNVALLDKDTGDIDIKLWSYSSDEYKSKGEIEREYMFDVPWGISKPRVEVMDVQLDRVWHQKGTPW